MRQGAFLKKVSRCFARRTRRSQHGVTIIKYEGTLSKFSALLSLEK